MALIPPSLTDMGFVLFGSAWEEPMAVSLEVADEDIQAWVADPTKIPSDMEDKLQALASTRIEEIQFFKRQLTETGLSRSLDNLNG